MANSVNAGANELKRANFGSNLEQWKAKYEGGWSVATFQRRDIPRSRRPHVVTSQRRDVGSTNTTVNKQRRRDVATSRRQREICPPSLKAARVQNWRHQEAYELGHRIPEQQRYRLRRSARDLYCFPFLDIRMMFLRLNIYIFLFNMF